MRKFDSIAAQAATVPELPALFELPAIDPHSELFVRTDGMRSLGRADGGGHVRC